MATTQSVSDSHSYSTQAVAQATGIPVTTILAWERRYGVPRPRRTENGRRLYSQTDLTLLEAMRARTAEGVRAEHAARELLAADGNPAAVRRVPLAYLPTEVHEINCLHCGEHSGELLTQHAPDGSRSRFVAGQGAIPPRRGPDGRPRCGRCGGDLYREPTERRSLPAFSSPEAVAVQQGAA